MDFQNIYKEFDLNQLGLLPDDWVQQVAKVANDQSIRTVLDGRSVTSREPSDIEPIEVYVVTGETIKNKLPWLYDLYRGELLKFASQIKNTKVVSSQDLQSGININLLRGKGSRYEWHVDSNPVTGLLFVTTHEVGDGGELIFKVQDEKVTVHPKSGTFIVFDAREIPHTVTPLINSFQRISIPMNYYFSQVDQERPEDLTSYLYTKSE